MMIGTLIPLDEIPEEIPCTNCGRMLTTPLAIGRGLGSACWARLHLARLRNPHGEDPAQLSLETARMALRGRRRMILAFRRARSAGRRNLMRAFA